MAEGEQGQRRIKCIHLMGDEIVAHVLVSSLVWGSLVATAVAGGVTARQREPVP